MFGGVFGQWQLAGGLWQKEKGVLCGYLPKLSLLPVELQVGKDQNRGEESGSCPSRQLVF